MPRRLTREVFIERATKIHSGLYDYAEFEYIHSNVKSTIICREGHRFLQTPHSHLDVHGCSKCAKAITANINRLDEADRQKRLIEFVTKAQEIHGNIYDYGLFEYVNAVTKGKIVCKIHTTFEQSPNTHLKGHGCPYCGQHRASTNHRYTTKEFIRES